MRSDMLYAARAAEKYTDLTTDMLTISKAANTGLNSMLLQWEHCAS